MFRAIKRLSIWLPDSGHLFSVIIKILYLFGLWPDRKATQTMKLFYKAYEITLHGLIATFDVIATIGVYSQRNDPITMIESFDKTLIAYQATAKVILFMVNRKHLQALIDDILSSGDVITRKRDGVMTKLVIFTYAAVTFTMTVFTLSAMYHGELVIGVWFPFDATKDKKTAFYFNQFIVVIFIPNIWRMLGMQCLYCCLLIYLCDQLDDLQERLNALNYSKENDEDVRLEFGEIVKKHCRIIRYVKMMSKGYKHILLVQNLSVTVELCLTAFMVSTVGTSDTPRLVNFACLLMVTLFNAYMYCYLGNELISKSEGVSRAAYEAPWTSWPLDLQKDLLVMICSSQRALYLSTGLSVMSLETYCTILYNGYSIFAMLYDVAN